MFISASLKLIKGLMSILLKNVYFQIIYRFLQKVWKQISNLQRGVRTRAAIISNSEILNYCKIILSEGSDPINQKSISLSITHIFHFRQNSASCLNGFCKICHCSSKIRQLFMSFGYCLFVFSFEYH